jgi:hypothetical protein
VTRSFCFAFTYALLCFGLWIYLNPAPDPAPLPIAPFCKDPYAEFNKRAWDYCDLVDRYYEI